MYPSKKHLYSPFVAEFAAFGVCFSRANPLPRSPAKAGDRIDFSYYEDCGTDNTCLIPAMRNGSCLRALALRLILLVALVIGFSPSSGLARTIVLAWDPSPDSDVVTYVVRYGSSSGDYTHTASAGINDSISLELRAGVYYCTVSATNSAGLESLPSEELSFSVVQTDAPTLVGLTDGESLNGPAPLNLQITEPIRPFTRIEIFADSQKIGDVSSQSSSATWESAPPGDYTLIVKASDDTGASVTSDPVLVRIVRPSIEWTPDPENPFALTVKGAPGRMQTVYGSDDLVTWTLLQSQVNESGTMTLSDDEAATKRQSFYRVVSE